ncbi:MAG: hypothetical protein IPK27_20400 [Rhodanobacteraceae bacterium]|nr:hypothetical protein [Rhodanobacteraceae bacterium]
MNMSIHSMPVGRVRLLFWATGFALFSDGLAAAAPGTVDLLATPPEITASVAPNVVLTFDDSGSMAWEYMPDQRPYGGGGWGISTSVTTNSSHPWFCAGRIDGLVSDPANPRSKPMNGMYYDPNVTYRPPLNADGVTEFPQASFTAAWNHGIAHNRPSSPNTTLGTRNLRTSSFCRTAQPLADATYYQLEGGDFAQDWEDTGLISANNNWNGVPHLYGYANDRSGSTVDINPQTLTGYTTTSLNVTANSTNPATTSGGIFELSGASVGGNPTIGLQGASNRDAPYILLRLNTVRCTAAQLQYRLRDLNPANITAVQQIDVQIRTPDSGNFTSINYHANANNGGVIDASVNLDAAYLGQEKVQIRWMTTNASGNDNMIGVDDIKLIGTCTQQTTDENAGYYRLKDSVTLTTDAFGRITTDQATLYDAANWEWVPLPVSQRQNFANWYSYYRNRNRSATTAMSRAFAPFNENIRVAWQNLGLNTATAGVDAPIFGATTPIYKFLDEASNSNVRTRFYDWLFQIPASGSTPNIAASIRAGDFFKRAGGAVDTNPYWDRDLSRELSCRQNFHINMSDGFWNNGNPAPATAGSPPARRYLDTNAALPDGRSYNTGNAETKFFNRFAGTPIEPSLADVMFHYWASDLRPDFAGQDSTRLKVPPFIPDRSTNLFGNPVGSGQNALDNLEVYWNPANDPATWPHLVNFNISFGLEGTLPQTPDVYESLRLGDDPAFIWPYPVVGTDDGRKLDDFWHAALVSRGRFLSAQNPEELITSLQEIIASIIARRGASTAVSVSLPIITDGTTGYAAGYDTTDWSGFVTRNELDPNTAESIGIEWDAGCFLTGGPCPTTVSDYGPARNPDTREIITSNGTSGSGKPFRWANLSSQQRARLNVDPTTIRLDLGTWSTDTFGDERVAYLRGDRTNETTETPRFRQRSSVLGGVIRGQPVYVSSPISGYPDTFPNGSPERIASDAGNSYARFQNTNRNRAPTLYVGANDGMLHAFNASTGAERFAYVPNAVIENFRLTRSTQFEGGLTPTVDDAPLVTDVFINGSWRTVLLGSLRLGGRGVYLLDISNPTGTTDSSPTALPMREVTNVPPPGDTSVDCAPGARYCSSLGYTYTGVNTARIQYQNKWVALVSSGYFPIDSLDPASLSPKANQTSLLVIDMATGQLIREIITSTAPQSATQSFGLSQAIVMDVGGDYIDDVAFAGDLAGNMWRFDLTGSPAEWKVDLMFKTYGTGGVGVGDQPIAASPRVMSDSTRRSPLIVFGTGKFIGLPDRSAAIPQQSFYGIKDLGTCDTTDNPAACSAYPTTPDHAVVQKITQASNAVRSIGPSSEPTPSNPMGWRLRLDVASEPGERAFESVFPFYGSNAVLLRSIIPKGVDPCDPGARYGLMVVNAATGSAILDPTSSSPSSSGVVGGVISTPTPPGKPVVVRGGGDVEIPGLPPDISDAVMDAIEESLEEADDVWHRGAWREILNQ